ncbi:MAG: hypothetical protein ABSD21_02975 [Rhizomicrobium sp.]|jgi:hypothetical protein
MSIVGGLVDAHHEMELSPSVRLIRSSWLARHLGTILLVGVAVALYFAL